MLNINTIRERKDFVIEGLHKKNFPQPEAIIENLLSIDAQRRQFQQKNEEILAQINAASKNIGQLMAQGKKDEAEALKIEVLKYKESIKSISDDLSNLEKSQYDLLVQLPNLPHIRVPNGKSAEDNEIVFQSTENIDINAAILPHWELADKYKIIDFELGTKITGSGFPVYTAKGAKLQRALINYFLDFNTERGYQEFQVPHLVNEDSAFGTGQLPDKEGQMYHATEDNFYLIPTAEVPLTNIFRDEIISSDKLPIQVTAYSPCFRREAGSYGKDVRGLNRLHQFDKVEIMCITEPEKSYEMLDSMVEHVKDLLTSLKLPFRILRLCGGDMSFTSALTYDFEVYSAAQKRWLEVSSVSNFETFQANRMKIRYKGSEGKPQLVHTLNGSSLALPRIVACILENYQMENGIQIPEVLQSYMKSTMIS